MVLVRFFDFIGRKMGQSFGIIFKIIIPFLVTFVPMDIVSTLVSSGDAKIVSIILWLIFFVLLIIAPKVASVVEFFVIGFAMVFAFGYGIINHWWGYAIMISAGVFLFFKILFLINILIKKADGTYETEQQEEKAEKYIPDKFQE
ncbi:MAG: hypothetical protein J1F17_00320 [Oscillospiraceae bacterium]|nr:hypothetical protein [Oscillospiraceae bacterium]